LLSITGRTDADFKATGPAVHLEAREVVALGLAFHELATNALKYGGLAHEGGTLAITWEVLHSGRGDKLRLVWQETSPETIAGSAPEGFGAKLIDTAVTRELHGAIERNFRPDGLTVVITFPLAGERAQDPRR
jgi:two-component sensor histidine kinase